MPRKARSDQEGFSPYLILAFPMFKDSYAAKGKSGAHHESTFLVFICASLRLK
jgi:hypothetical protein